MRHIPNLLSAIRILLVGTFVGLFLAGSYLPALSVYVLAFLTDVLDGYLARRYNWTSDLGKLLDPLADKLMTVSALICIYIGRHRTVYLVLFLLVLVKELLMLVGGLLMARRSVFAFSAWPGKTAMGLFAAGVVLSLLAFPLPLLEPWSVGLLVAATALSYFALIYYAVHQLSFAMRQPVTAEKGAGLCGLRGKKAGGAENAAPPGK